MFLGHYAAGLAAKRWAPEAPLGALVAGAVGLDLVWPFFVLAGVERVAVVPGITRVTPLEFQSYPYSHSLVAAALWALAAGGLFYYVRRSARAAAAVAACVISHWLLDWAAHRPDLPLTLAEGASRHGLGLWNSLPGTLAVELACFAASLALYLKVSPPAERRGNAALWVFCAVLGLVYLGALFGPPPPSGQAVAASALGQWLFCAWAGWIDASRRSVH